MTGATSADTLRVLIVDDDEVDRMAVRRALRAGGFTVDARDAADVATALDALRAEVFDCVFLDFQLPGGDGLRVLREARAAGIRSPIIVLTGQQDEELAVELMKAGASDYIPKGKLTPERLEQGVRHAIRVFKVETLAGEAQEALLQSEERFRILHETSPDAFVVFRSVRDEAGRIVDFTYEYANPAAGRMVGKSPSELLGKRLREFYPNLRDEELFGLYIDVVETGDPRQREMHYEHDGLDLWVRVTAARIGDGFAASYSDITPRRRAEEERERAVAARARFYAAMSHELRTPINAILGYTDLLLFGAYGVLDETQTTGIERTHRAAKHLLELVNDVLDLSKLEAGKQEIETEPTVLPELVEDLFVTVLPMAEERGSELVMRHAECDEPVLTDPRWVRQILLNLLSNAIKFGRSRPVEVTCGRAGDGRFFVTVRDQGIGIPEGELSRIFEEFVQLSEARERGTGLGLAISKRLAELLGGELEVESKPGEGSEFRLYLPVRHEGPAPAGSIGNPVSATAGRPAAG